MLPGYYYSRKTWLNLPIIQLNIGLIKQIHLYRRENQNLLVFRRMTSKNRKHEVSEVRINLKIIPLEHFYLGG